MTFPILMFSTIRLIHPDKSQRVTHESSLNGLVHKTRRWKTWQHIDLNNPRFKVLVDHDIEAIYLETVVFHVDHTVVDLWFNCYTWLDTYISDLIFKFINVTFAVCFKLFDPDFVCPFWCWVIFQVFTFVLGSGFLVDRLISQMRKSVGSAGNFVFMSSESD